MTFPELLRLADPFLPAAELERLDSYEKRHRTTRAFGWAVFLTLALGLLAETHLVDAVSLHVNQVRGLFLVVFSLWVAAHCLEAYFFSYYFREARVDYDAAALALLADRADFTGSLLGSRLGRYALMRLGVSAPQLATFVGSDRGRYPAASLVVDPGADGRVSLAELAEACYRQDEGLRAFLDQRAIRADHFREAFDWVAREEREARDRAAWWREENLGRAPSIGRAWAYGQTYQLERIATPISRDPEYARAEEASRAFAPAVARVEAILAAGDGGNAFVVAPELAAAFSVVAAVAKRAARGDAPPLLEGRRFYVLDAGALASTVGSREDFENAIRRGLAQAALAGDVAVVLTAVGNAVEAARAFGSDFGSIVQDAAASRRLPLVAIESRRAFHDTVEPDRDLMRSFERVVVESPEGAALARFVEEEADAAFGQTGVFATVQAVFAVAEDTRRYLDDGAPEDRAADLLRAAMSGVAASGRSILGVEDVHAAVRQITGVPAGEVGEAERATLGRLEEELRERVVGQEAAVKAVAEAVRRARAGLASSDRPLASFLFLGPTGVGKTETAKALAASYFGGEERMVRFDMSEFSGADALGKLIGFPGEGQGALASSLREKRGGLLLVDEFEKASKPARDLFLQILDEGRFTDASGEKVSAKNFVVVATSNAGASLYYEALSKGEPAPARDAVVAAAVREGSFSPELLNRFDGVVCFAPLSAESRQGVAATLLRKAGKKLAEKSIKLLVTQPLLDYVAKAGENQAFGARAMRRAVEGEIEAAVADAIVAGQVRPGDSVQVEAEGGRLAARRA